MPTKRVLPPRSHQDEPHVNHGPRHHLMRLWVRNAVCLRHYMFCAADVSTTYMFFQNDLELLVLFQFIAGLLSTEPTVVLVDTVVTDAGIFIPNLSLRIVMLSCHQCNGGALSDS